MTRLKPKYIFLPFIPTDKNAVTIYPFIFWSKKKKGWLRQDIIVHEMYHWNEQNHWRLTKTFGLLQWFLKYILLWFYFNVMLGLKSQEHPMEKPAYQQQYQYREH
jgi:hypothetical protein